MELAEYNSRVLPDGALLWHYTDFRGLEGILNGRLWASCSAYLNDTGEFHHGIAIALEILRTELADQLKADYAPHGPAIFGEVNTFFSRRYKPKDLFVASLSAKQDDLSQWRAYGGSGPMFSVGFLPRVLEEQAEEFSFSLVKIEYDRVTIVADLRAALHQPLDEIKRQINALQNRNEAGRQIPAWALTLANELMLLCPRYKDPKFADESEWRLIRRSPIIDQKPRRPWMFRQSRSLIIPYIDLPLHKARTQEEVFADGEIVQSSLVQIMVGPSPHPEELKNAVGEMAARKGLAVAVEGSTIPFRNW